MRIKQIMFILAEKMYNIVGAYSLKSEEKHTQYGNIKDSKKKL